MKKCYAATNPMEASPRTQRRHASQQCLCYGVTRGEHKTTATVNTPAGEPSEPTGSVETTSQGGEFKDVRTNTRLELASDWDHVFLKFGLDPKIFTIVDDTVRAKTWNQSKALEDGTRDVVSLYSYGARFTRKSEGALTEADYTAAQERLRSYQLPRRIPGSGLGEPVAAVLNLADMQLHKPDGDGLTGTLDRLTHGLENFQAYVDKHRKHGVNLNEIAIVNNGDPFEGIAGNYANQLKTVKAGLREQMNTVLDVWEMYSRALYPQFDKGQFITVHCNHTAFGRQGGAKDSITGDEDTGSAFLAEALQRILRGRSDFDHVDFVIPHDEMNVYADIAGVPVGFNHGHKIPGSGADGFEKWLNGQVRGDKRAYEARIWITAHRHSLQFFDIGSAQVFQCPSCDGGSKWLRDTTGKFSQSGILALLVGNHHKHGWSDNASL